MFKNRLRLFWWNEKIIQGKSKENYGDALGKYLVEKISGKKVVFAWSKKFSFFDFIAPIHVTIGSILTNVNHNCIVWGSGIITKTTPIKKATFLAVRGPQTRKYLLALGFDVPEVYGDPALLLPRYYNPKIEKKFKYGIVPHYNDYKVVVQWFKNSSDIHLIDIMTNDIESKTIEFLQCERIISSSLHGIIVAHSYGIPAVWQKFSDQVFGDDIKFQDYMESVQIPFYQTNIKTEAYTDEEMHNLFTQFVALPNPQIIEDLRNGLMEACPFQKSEW